ncbi:hypothetical protein ACFV4X_00140 [Streptomyces ardesiacus]|uniref:hypothetical protein n=1 Tax=Streptomyces ardesiacus TaxID=285564 RepID=UPI00365AD091
MDGILNLTTPYRCPTNLIRASISFHHKEITHVQLVAIQLSLKKLDQMHIVKLKPSAGDIRDSKKRKGILDGTPFLLLLNSTTHLSHVRNQAEGGLDLSTV